jgi:K+-sensing histidine kinase KdpD
VLRQQQIINKQWHHLQNKKAKETQWLVAIGVTVVMMLCIVLMIVHSTRKQQRDKKRITEQAQQLKLQNTEIKQRAVALKKSIGQLEELQVFRQKMEAMIMLDLQRPLATINQLVMTPPSKEGARLIYQAGQRMNHTIANVLDVQKFKKVGIKPSLKPHLFNQLIHQALEKVDQISLPNNINLHLSISPIKVNVDEALMIRVLVNLLTMSAKLAQPNQPISIATTLESGHARVVISVEKEKSGELTHPLDHYETNDPSQAIANSAANDMLLTFCEMVVNAHQGTVQMSTSSVTQTIYYGFELPQVTSFGHPEKDEVTTAHRLKFNFNESEKKQLSICLPLLQKQLVYQVSSIEQLLVQIEAQKESELDRWKEALLNAVENCDNKTYTTLIYI